MDVCPRRDAENPTSVTLSRGDIDAKPCRLEVKQGGGRVNSRSGQADSQGLHHRHLQHARLHHLVHRQLHLRRVQAVNGRLDHSFRASRLLFGGWDGVHKGASPVKDATCYMSLRLDTGTEASGWLPWGKLISAAPMSA